jgi:Mg-chelatase subunit ChlI
MPQHYPFSAVVGSDDMALALTLSTISPAIGGVLVRGEKGTAKSTMVRALASILPPIEVVSGDRFSTDPRESDPLSPDGPFAPDAATETRPVRLVELPVGATEDRVLGSLHLEKALSEGVTEYEPGCWPARTAASSTSTRSTSCTTTSSTCCSTPRRWAGRPSSATASRSSTPPASSSSAP